MPGPEAKIRKRFRDNLPKGWLRIAFVASEYTGPGRSDDFVLAEGKFVVVEWKAEGNKPTPKQIEFIGQVRAAGGHAFLARQASEAIKAITMITQGITPYREDSVDLDFLFGDSPPPVAEEDEERLPFDEPPGGLPSDVNDLLDGVSFTSGSVAEFNPMPDFAPDPGLASLADPTPDPAAFAAALDNAPRQRRARRRRDVDEVMNGIKEIVEAPVEAPQVIEMPTRVATGANGAQAPNLLDAMIEQTAVMRELIFEMSAMRTEIAALLGKDS